MKRCYALCFGLLLVGVVVAQTMPKQWSEARQSMILAIRNRNAKSLAATYSPTFKYTDPDGFKYDKKGYLKIFTDLFDKSKSATCLLVWEKPVNLGDKVEVKYEIQATFIHKTGGKSILNQTAVATWVQTNGQWKQSRIVDQRFTITTVYPPKKRG